MQCNTAAKEGWDWREKTNTRVYETSCVNRCKSKSIKFSIRCHSL